MDEPNTGEADLHDEIAAIAAETDVPPWHALSVESARQVEDELFSAGKGPEVDRVWEFGIDRPDEEGEVPIRAYHPPGETVEADAPPVIVFYHGGGWVMGTLDSADDLGRNLSRRAGALVLSVDYRLAPEHPFPAAVEDAHAAAEWASVHAADLGGDPDRLAVAGTSAGGALAAATAMRVPESIAVQALLYPITDAAFDTDSQREHADAPFLGRRDLRWFWDLYLRSPVDAHHPFAAPLVAREELLDRAPPAVVVTAGHDPLRDEGRAYADRLRSAGVAVDDLHYPTMCHGFLSLADRVDPADEAFDSVVDSLRSWL